MNHYNENLVNVVAPFSLIPQQHIVRDDKGIASEPFVNQIYPNESGSFGGEDTRVVTFDLASVNSAVDLLRSTLEGTITYTGVTGAIDGDSHSLFSRVRLLAKSGTVVFEDVLGYNVKHIAEKVLSVGAEHCNTNWSDLSDNMLLSDDPTTLPKPTIGSGSANTAGIKFQMVPDLSFIQRCKILHLPVVGPMVLEFTFDDSRNVLSSHSATLGNIQVDALRFNARFLPLTPEFIGKLHQAVANGEMLYSFDGVYRQTATWSTSTSNTMSIQYGVKSANAVLLKWYLSGDALGSKVGIANAKRYLQKSQYPSAPTSAFSIQLQHGSMFIPQQAIASPQRAIEETLGFMNMSHAPDSSNLVTRQNYAIANANVTLAGTPAYFVGINLQRASQNTGLDLDGTSLILRTQGDQVSNLVCDMYVYFSQVVRILPNHAYVIDR